MYRKITTVTLIAALLLTGCGKEKPEEITNYGTEAASVTSDTETTAYEASAHSGQYLSSQLGGEKLDYENSFNIGSLNAKMDVHCQFTKTPEEHINGVSNLTDTDVLPVWSVHGINENRVYEEEIVASILKDAAPVKHFISGDDSEFTKSACIDYAGVYGDGDLEKPTETISTWNDTGDYYLHTYEGKYLDTDYQLVIGYRKDWKCKTIYLGPKNWGSVSTDPNLNYCIDINNHAVMLPDENGQNYMDYDLNEIMNDPENKCSKNRDTLLKDMKEFTETLKLKLPDDSMIMPLSSGDTAENSRIGSEMLFIKADSLKTHDDIYNYREVTRSGISEGVLDGYIGSVRTSLGGQDIAYSGDSDYFMSDYGQIYLNDKGVIACNLFVFFEFDKCLSERAAILPFDKAMGAFEENIASVFDVSKATGSELKFSDAAFGYTHVESPENPGEFTFIPVWVLGIVSNGNYYMGQVVQNAMDGSIINVYIPEE